MTEHYKYMINCTLCSQHIFRCKNICLPLVFFQHTEHFLLTSASCDVRLAFGQISGDANPIKNRIYIFSFFFHLKFFITKTVAEKDQVQDIRILRHNFSIA